MKKVKSLMALVLSAIMLLGLCPAGTVAFADGELIETAINIEADAVFVDQKAVIKVSVTPEEAEGDITVYIDGREYTPVQSEYDLTVTVPCALYPDSYNGQGVEDALGAGPHLVRAEFKGSNNYACAQCAEVLTVAKLQPEISIAVEKVFVEGDVATIFIYDYRADINEDNTVVIVDGESFEIKNDLVFYPVTAGYHTVTLIYQGDINHEYCAVSETFFGKPNFGNGMITLSVPDVTGDENAVATVYYKDTDTQNEDISFILKNSAGEIVSESAALLSDYDYDSGYATGTVDFGILEPGEYTVEAAIDQSDNQTYVGYYDEKSFTVREKTSLEIKTPQGTVYGDDAAIEFELSPAGASGGITAFVDGAEYSLTSPDGSISVSGLGAGSHLVRAYCEGDSAHSSAEAAAVFDIEKADVTVNAEMEKTIRAGESQVLGFDFSSADVTGKITLGIDEDLYTFPVIDGAAAFMTPVMEEGRHFLTFYYPGDANFNPFFASYEFLAVQSRSRSYSRLGAPAKGPDGAPAAGTIAIRPIAPVTFGEDAVIELVLSDPSATGEIAVTINGTEYITDTEHLTLTVPTYSEDQTITGGNLMPGAESYLTQGENSFNTHYFNIPYSPYEPSYGCLCAGGYTVTAEYRGDETHAPAKAYELLTVNRQKPSINVEFEENGGVCYAIINVTSTVSDLSRVCYIDGNDYPINNSKVYIPSLEPGRHTLLVATSEQSEYSVCISGKNDEFAVLPVTFTVPGDGMAVYAPDTLPGEQTEITVSIPDGVYSEEYDLTLRVNDVTGRSVWTEDITDFVLNGSTGMWEAAVGFTPAEPGRYTAVAGYNGSVASCVFNAAKKATEIRINNPGPVSAGDDAEITAELIPAQPDSVIRYYIDGSECTPDGETGKVTVSEPEPGAHLIEAVYEGNKNFAGSKAYDLLRVEKAEQSIDVEIVPKISSNESNLLNLTLPSREISGTMTVFINNEEQSLPIERGLAQMNIPPRPAGQVVISAYYPGDESHGPAFTLADYEVIKAKPEITVSEVDAAYGETVDIMVTIAGGNATGTITVDGKDYEVKDGQVTFPFTPSAAGMNAVLVEYSGDENYGSGNQLKAYNVAKGMPAMTVTVTPENPVYGEDVTVKVTVPEDAGRTADAGGMITLILDGTEYAVDDAVNGVLNNLLQDLAPGEHTVEAVYCGDSNYKAASAEKSFTVTALCPVTIYYVYENGETAATAYNGSVEINKGYSVTSPEITGYTPDKAKVEGTMESTDGIKVTVKYTANTYKATYIVDGGQFAEFDVAFGQPVTQPRTPQKEGYKFAWIDEIPDTMPADNITINGKFTPVEYTATFVNEKGETVKEIPYTVETASIKDKEPEVPGKDGYTGEWEEYKLALGGITIEPEYTAIEYTATFVADGKTAGEVKFTVETEKLKEPAVPVKEGYEGKWSGYTIAASDMTVNAEYTAIEYKATFVADGKTVAEIPYTVETKNIKAPAVPEKEGYTGKWEEYKLAAGGVTVNAKYTAIEYKAIFVADGKTVAEIPYTVETKNIEAPAVPEKEGYTGEWEEYELAAGGVTVNAVYTENEEPDEPENEDLCPLDEKDHGTSFWGKLIRFIHTVIYKLFKLFGVNLFIRINFNA